MALEALGGGSLFLLVQGGRLRRRLTQALDRIKETSTHMDKKQADVVARSILEPGSRAQEEVRLKRATVANERSRRQRIAWFTLGGFAVGSAVAYVGVISFVPGFFLGGLVGSLVGYVITRRSAV